jgi:hypothetical protein
LSQAIDAVLKQSHLSPLSQEFRIWLSLLECEALESLGKCSFNRDAAFKLLNELRALNSESQSRNETIHNLKLNISALDRFKNLLQRVDMHLLTWRDNRSIPVARKINGDPVFGENDPIIVKLELKPTEKPLFVRLHLAHENEDRESIFPKDEKCEILSKTKILKCNSIPLPKNVQHTQITFHLLISDAQEGFAQERINSEKSTVSCAILSKSLIRKDL